MKKPDIVRQWAQRAGTSDAEAADQLDRAVRQILAQLRKDEQVPLPGVGRFLLGPDRKVTFEGERHFRRG